MRNSGLVLFACAGLLLSGGAILGGSTVWCLLRMSYYFWTSELGVELGSGVLIVAGSLLCLPACWLATLVPYHNRSVALHGTLMCLVSVALLLLSTGLSASMALTRAVRDPGAVNATMLRSMALDPFDPAVRTSFATMQLELKCCGVLTYNDWYQHRRSLPPSCCGLVSNGKRTEVCTVPLYPTGCLRPALAELRAYSNSLAVLTSSIIIVLAVTLFAAAYTLVSGIVERGEARSAKPPQQFRIACLGHAPLASFTSPAFVSSAPPPPPAMM